MYSALKHNGQPLYKLARQGIEVERAARSITIYDYQILDFRPGVIAELDVRCDVSKGTYMRSLAEDLGQMLWLWRPCQCIASHIGRPLFMKLRLIHCQSLQDMRESCRARAVRPPVKAHGYRRCRPHGRGIDRNCRRILPVGAGSNVNTGLSQWARRRYSARLSRGRCFSGCSYGYRRRQNSPEKTGC